MKRAAAVALALVAAACTGGDDEASGPGDEWTHLSPMAVARSEHPATVVDGAIVVVGGLVEGADGIAVTATVEAYAPDTDSWESLPDLPEPRHHTMAVTVAGRLFVIGGFGPGGFQPVSTTWELVDEEWIPRAPLPQPVGAGGAAVIDDGIYVAGGTPGGNSLVRYDPSEDRWDELPSLLERREHTAAVALDGELWVLGGRWDREMLASVEIFDPASMSWRTAPAMREARSGFGAALTPEGVVVAGGEVFGPTSALRSVERLEPTGGSWVRLGDLPEGRHGIPLVEVGGTLYLPGGSTLAGGVENDGVLLARR